eukprot:gene16899-23189_t
MYDHKFRFALFLLFLFAVYVENGNALFLSFATKSLSINKIKNQRFSLCMAVDGRYIDETFSSNSKRRRRSNVGKETSNSQISTDEAIQVNANVEMFNKPPTKPIVKVNPEIVSVEPEKLLNAVSKLPPIKGTNEELKSKYNEKNFIEKNFGDYLSPTPTGQEPKLIQGIKTVTWAAVLILVLVEIFVSVKVGGMPFDFGGGEKVSTVINNTPIDISNIPISP